ncbi:hypothetical protein ILYODFUR_039149, partial [Ilyodon furcidens]
ESFPSTSGATRSSSRHQVADIVVTLETGSDQGLYSDICSHQQHLSIAISNLNQPICVKNIFCNSFYAYVLSLAGPSTALSTQHNPPDIQRDIRNGKYHVQVRIRTQVYYSINTLELFKSMATRVPHNVGQLQ